MIYITNQYKKKESKDFLLLFRCLLTVVNLLKTLQNAQKPDVLLLTVGQK